MATADPTPLVITVWETYGSRMEEVALELARRTGLPVHPQAYSSVDVEQARSKPQAGPVGPLLRTLIPGLVPADGRHGVPVVTEASLRDLTEANTAAVARSAADGGILLGRNGQFLLAGRPNTVHVKLDGPVEERIASAARAGRISVERARRRQEVEDAFRAELSLRTYRFDPRDNDLYDVVLNGARLTPAQAADVIVAMVGARLGRRLPEALAVGPDAAS